MTILMSNIERGHYVDRPPYTPYWSDCYQSPNEFYLERASQNPNLVICFGDSWTWGASLLLELDQMQDDPELRGSMVYGRKLADKLQADFVNCALPGIFNHWILDRLQIVLEHDLDRLTNLYANIWIIVTLTEIGRDFVFENYVTDFEKWCTHTDLADAAHLALACERFDFVRLGRIQQQLPSGCHLIVARNFTHTQTANLPMLPAILPRSWTDILFDLDDLAACPPVLMLGNGIFHFSNYVQSQGLHKAHYKEWFLEHVDGPAQCHRSRLRNCRFITTTDSKHPNPTAHEIWSQYLYETIQSRTVTQ